MESQQRARIKAIIKSRHKEYLGNLSPEQFESHNIGDRFKRLRRRVNDLIRKETASNNAVKEIPRVLRLIFGLHEDISRLRLPPYSFETEKQSVNLYVRDYLERCRVSKYDGECASYGETLLNCYLDAFITLTVPKTPKFIGVRPSFLVNPATGNTLELDILLEDFRLAFEFQGEHHYTDSVVMAKDIFKLRECGNRQRILIPVNVSQLNSELLANLIANSVKEYLHLHEVLVSRDPQSYSNDNVKKQQIAVFCKAVQRIHLAKILLSDCLEWLDQLSNRYITNLTPRSPISSSAPAPRLRKMNPDLNLEYIYRNIRYASNIPKQNTRTEAVYSSKNNLRGFLKGIDTSVERENDRL